MSPEQAKGRNVDERTDVWAFGCVLYEMLTGRQVFRGEEVSEILASVLAREPDYTTLPPKLHPRLKEVLERCLEKNLRKRFRGIGDVIVDIEKVLADPSGVWVKPFEDAVQIAAPSRLPWLGAFCVGAIVAGLAVWLFLQPGSEPVLRANLIHPGDEILGGGIDAGVAIAPDGRRIVYVAGNGNLGRLYLRDLDQPEPIVLAEVARDPFFSPDSQWVGFRATTAGPWMKVAVTGGPAVMIGGGDGSAPRGATWAPDDTIVFATVASTGLSRISAAGGEAEVLTTPDLENGEIDHLFPEFLPGGRALLFTITNDQGIESSQVALLDLDTLESRVLIQGGGLARYAASGYIIYGVAGTLRAVAFDLDSLQVRGTPVPVVDNVLTQRTGAASFSVSPLGTLVYLSGDALTNVRTLIWVDRSGGSEPIPSIPPGNYGNPRLSPDGGRVLISADGDAWIYDIATGRRSAVTTDGMTSESNFVWSPDGNQVAYSSSRSGNNEVWIQAADGSGEPQPVTQLGGGSVDVDSWSPNGDVLAVHQHNSDTGTDILMIPLGEARPMPQPFLVTEFGEDLTQFSPDGRFVAYLSDRTGERQVYIRPYPGPGAPTTVSVDGGVEPIWGRNGELFYRNPDSLAMMRVVVATEPELRVGIPELLFEAQGYSGFGGASPSAVYDVTEDGQRFLMEQNANVAESDSVSQINIVTNWFEELKQRVPVP